MALWKLACIVMFAGGVGGVVSAILSEDRGFVLPTKVDTDGKTVVRPGFIGLVLVGAVAAVLSWGLYGPLADQNVFGGKDPVAGGDVVATTSDDLDDDFGLTLSALAGAVLVGIGGSKWLSTEVDKRLLEQAAEKAAKGPANDELAEAVRNLGPAAALQVARDSGAPEG